MDKARKRKAAHTGRPPNEQLTNNDSSIPASQLGSSISESLLPSQRVVRQRALLSSDLPRPESSTAAETRKKRKAAIASGRQEENSESPLHNRHRRNCSLRGHSGPISDCCYMKLLILPSKNHRRNTHTNIWHCFRTPLFGKSESNMLILWCSLLG
ncbi:uncharacterized protein LOC120683010 isoform X2 [Panicum virgatum]|uniref:uncharacterized protein LOC120683010 isoform X2 n=1 Tax=Panicum virgatum TaxID=38727 RepID=UPI0019D4EF28|nr:uncharacterized protein LOC120683010 isoform X2 [Panicum virgatum]